VALTHCASHGFAFKHEEKLQAKIKELLEAVGLDYGRDANKRPSQLSGGMARRASLAMQLAQKKRIIDEPFTGLDREAACSIAKELVRLRVEHQTALVLISHEPDLANMVMDPNSTADNFTLILEPAGVQKGHCSNGNGKLVFSKPSLFGMTLLQRFLEDLEDFIMWSFPLVIFAFLACGIAIAMLSCDILQRIDVTEHVLDIVSKEVRPLVKMLTGEEANALTMMMINMKIKGMLNTVMPEAKAKLYALGMAKLFVLEIGPLLTALLLCGRIGGSYAGKVATMQATAQNKLLRTLGISAQFWTLVPALAGAILAAPFLTAVGTIIALFVGAAVGPQYGIGEWETYSQEVYGAVFPALRLRSVVDWQSEQLFNSEGHFLRRLLKLLTSLDVRCTFSNSYKDTLVEVLTYPPCFLLVKAVVFITVILMVAETAARLRPNLTPRNVPSVITSSVVIASLLVIVADWGFSQLWLLRQ